MRGATFDIGLAEGRVLDLISCLVKRRLAGEIENLWMGQFACVQMKLFVILHSLYYWEELPDDWRSFLKFQELTDIKDKTSVGGCPLDTCEMDYLTYETHVTATCPSMLDKTDTAGTSLKSFRTGHHHQRDFRKKKKKVSADDT
ncbi:hypothetical protein CEXT_423801 [Caerostris extrusa]|uniref:Uncharacterized protein n=1 Tax=Caerostris extrusa TaxID=172846 RepID=A0AAV4XXK9_CAEEX|nr:hypothetical protein CEXT_423801 [Caerostris extrusa]